MTWTDRWIGLALHVAGWSKDRSRKTGAVIVDDRNVLLAIGWNGFPRGLDDDRPERHERPQKYQWTEHAERNAIYNAAAIGVAIRGARMFMPWYPCADCARAIIQSGISGIVAGEPDWSDPRWATDFAVVSEMLSEAGIGIVFVRAAPLVAGESIPDAGEVECICPAKCDCQNPNGAGVAHLSVECPEHNTAPLPAPGCYASTHRNGAIGSRES